MQSIVMFTNRGEWGFSDWPILREVSVNGDSRFTAETSGSWIGIYRDYDDFEHYEEDEEQLIRSILSDPVAYSIEWRGETMLRKFVEEFPLSTVAVIDNDHGLICKISDLRGLNIGDWVYVGEVRH